MTSLLVNCEFSRPTGFRLSADFTCGEGVTALCGPSGSGKSTILHLIAGLLRPLKGAIRLGSRTLTDVAARVHLPPERRRVGLVFQDGCLFPHLTVKENLDYGRRHNRASPLDMTHLVDVLEIAGLLNRSPLTLSGGERQRVALGRTLLAGPELILLDEPLAALDEPLQDKVLDYLQRVLSEYAIPTLFVTHSTAHVERLASRTLRLSEGRVVG